MYRENPADIASRGTVSPILIQNRLWWFGPNWLTNPEPQWPRQDKADNASDEIFKSELVHTN